MVELKAKLTKSGVLYIPNEIREAFGRVMRIIPDARAALFFPEHVSYADVLDSLEVIEAEIRHRMNLEAKELDR